MPLKYWTQTAGPPIIYSKQGGKRPLLYKGRLARLYIARY